MELKDYFTVNELYALRNLVSYEMLKASSILDRTGNSDNSLDKTLFTYWFDKYQVLKSAYDKLLAR